MPGNNISIIVAIADNNAIGKDNKLLWHLSEDLKRFKKITSGHAVIMGRNTFLSLPGGALAGRTNIVISDIPDEQFQGCKMAYSIQEALSLCRDYEKCFIIGGAMVYSQFLPYASKLYITRVHVSPTADTYFPEINYDELQEIYSEKNAASPGNEYDYTYLIYTRKLNNI